MNESRNWLKYITWFLFALAFLGVVLVGAVIGLRYYVRRGMTPAGLAEMDRFFDEPIQLPKEWQQVEPFPDYLVQAANRLQQDWGFVTDEGKRGEWVPLFMDIKAGRKITAEEWDRVRQVLTECAGFRTAVKDFVALPGYQLEAFPPAKPEHDTINLCLAVLAAEQLCLESYELGERGKCDTAFQPSLTAFQMLTRHPASQVPTHLVALYRATDASLCVAALTERCDDPEVLRALLAKLEPLDATVNMDALRDPLLVDAVGDLRWHGRRGEAVDLVSVQPPAYFVRQVHAWRPIDLELQDLRHWYSWYDPADWVFVHGSPFSRTGGEYLYRILWPNYIWTRFTEQSTESYFDLARLGVAVRIQELETNRPVEPTRELISRHFGKPLMDPFSNAPYRWNSEENRFYSVGPDRTDDSVAIRYDPTNGTLSRGDIVIGLPQPEPESN